MHILNWIDLIILGCIAFVVWLGIRIGFLMQLFVVFGSAATLVGSSWLIPRLLPLNDRTILTIINICLTAFLAWGGGWLGYRFGQRMRHRIRLHFNWRALNQALGFTISVAGTVIVIWLISATIGRLPFEGLSNSVQDSYIVQQLDRHLPAVPSLFASFNHVVDPNGSPHLFVTPIAQQLDPTVDASQFQPILGQATAATVRVTSFGCGGLVSGTGFIIAPQLVMTNAHVIAGVLRPIVKLTGRSYDAMPVYFDSQRDIAIVKTDEVLPAKPLTITSKRAADSAQIVSTGYPRGNFRISTGVIVRHSSVPGRNIYDEGIVDRDTYEIQVVAEEGDSGSPIILNSGSVVGMLFAKSDTSSNIAYALTADSLQTAITITAHHTERVGTGVCLAN